jgi:hypothetical protein
MHTLKRLAVWACLCIVMLLTACATKGDQIRSEHVGTRYSVEADGLYAYGVYGVVDGRRMTNSVHLIPMEVGGSEFSFRKREFPKVRSFGS